MLKLSLRSRQMIVSAALLVYLLFAVLKFDSILLLSDNLFENQVDLVDWSDDRFVQDKEFNAENSNPKLFTVNTPGSEIPSKLTADFFYSRIYKDIKLNISTPPPRIG